ncbi:alpha/beta fold hydrolase [Actinoplanes bogorensis]|uniref:Alpha/beta fold hydrolase n=1 Tax=Paractinoplanes bogorensis TaxID=1610840 RepID=A0ABS5YN44_9ACTN|nr:alpha/beta fold hydrolase [Actinoplanes bogorensis]MBU2664888.1 alpha/beta fold hydrolase [Actinoplanes bogorensis]
MDLARRWLPPLLALIAFATGGLLFARVDDGMVRDHVVADGVPLDIVRPPSADRTPGVVVVHGFAGSARLMAPFGDTLAARGYTVVLPDLDGHGANTRSPVDLQRDLDVAVAHLRSLPSVDPARIALVGHSMGATAVTTYAAAHPDIAATVAISLPSAVASPSPSSSPLLALVGQFEFPGFHKAASAAGGRAEVVPGAEHISILYASRTHHRTADWLDSTLDRPATGALPSPMRRLTAAGFLFLGLLLGFAPVTRLLLGRPTPGGGWLGRRAAGSGRLDHLEQSAGPGSSAAGSPSPVGGSRSSAAGGGRRAAGSGRLDHLEQSAGPRSSAAGSPSPAGGSRSSAAGSRSPARARVQASSRVGRIRSSAHAWFRELISPRFGRVAAVAAGAAVLAVLVAPFLPSTRLQLGGFTAGFTGLMGVAVLAYLRKPFSPPGGVRSLLAAPVLIAYTAAAIALPLQLGFTHAIPVGPRWWLLVLVWAGFAVLAYATGRLDSGSAPAYASGRLGNGSAPADASGRLGNGSVRASASGRAGGGSVRADLIVSAIAVAGLTAAAVTGLTSGFLVLVVPLLVVLMLIQCALNAILRATGSPPWLIALPGALLVAWPIATTLPVVM